MDGIQSVQVSTYTPPRSLQTSREPTPYESTPAVTVSPEERRDLDEMNKLSQAFYGTRLEYRFNEGLGQVVVKVIDQATDILIKEVPSREVQDLHIRLREMLGKHIDTLI